LLRVTDGNGNSDYIRDEQNHVVMSHLNVKLLQQIAGATEGGFYLPLSGAKTMDTLYERGLAPLPKSEHGEKTVRRYREQFYWPLVAAILLLLVEILLPERKRLASVAGVRSSGFSRSGPPEGGTPNTTMRVTAVLILLMLPGIAFGSPTSALRDYESKKFTEAQNEYERLAATNKTGDVRLVFNAGASAYRATNYDAAIKLFTTALTARDIKLQQAAYFNLGNTQFRLGQMAKDLDGMQQLWEVAIKSYQNAMTLNTNDVDAAFNLAFAKNGVAQIIQLREAARQAKESADAATRRRNYHRALEIMERLTQQNPLAKQFEEFTKKLKDIDAIATPNPNQP
jgi:Ca-activated chloride channel family protein